MLTAHLHAKRTFQANEKVLLTVTLQNSSAVAVRVLEWFTPLEGIRSECLRVWQNKEVVQYAGPLIKRGTPTSKNFRLVASGQSIDATFDLAQTYPLPAGAFRAKLDTTVYSAPADIPEADLPELWKQQKLPTQKLTSRSVQFRRPAGAPLLGRIPPPRHAELAAARLVRPLADFAAGIPLDTGPTVSFLPPDVSTLPADQQWFGVYTAAQAQRVWQVYRSILEELSRAQIVYHSSDAQQGGGPCRGGDIAIANPGDPNITLCGSFWDESPMGVDSQAGTLVHELSHVAAATADLAYGVRNCQAIAAQRPDLAINNADSYQYFAEWLTVLV